VPRRSSGRETKRPSGGTSWKDQGWDPVKGAFGGSVGAVITAWRKVYLKELDRTEAMQGVSRISPTRKFVNVLRRRSCQ
jgi:hypothetical protein